VAKAGDIFPSGRMIEPIAGDGDGMEVALSFGNAHVVAMRLTSRWTGPW
jgi:hypothetical protein